jgi:hypothetical protein
MQEKGATPMNTRFRPYVVGIGIGLLSVTVFLVVNAPLGITTSLSGVSGAALSPIVGAETIQNNPYWAKTVPALDYGTLFLIGTFLGALVTSILTGKFKLEFVPTVWSKQFGPSRTKRFIVAFVGGILAMYGARMAGGCTSGHGISGSLQLAVSSWVFFIMMFASGVITARIFFSNKEE